MTTGWKPFNYSDFECGLFWLLVESPDVDFDEFGGTVTDEVNRSAVLARVEEGDEGLPEFEPVDRENFGRIDASVGVVTHFAEIEAPALPAV